MNVAINNAYFKLVNKGFLNIRFYKMERDYFTFNASKDGEECTVFVNISDQEVFKVDY